MTNKSGFTLLELLVALSLLAVIGAGLAGAMQLGAESYTRAKSLQTRQPHVPARAQLRRMMARTISPSLLTPFPKEFRGSSDSLTFTTLASFGFARDAAGMRITLTQSEDRLLSTIQLFDDKGAAIEEHEAAIVEDIGPIAFDYYGAEGWLDTWENSSALPRLVRLRATEEAVMNWPEFTVELLYAN